MEAAVLKSQIMTEVGCSSGAMNAELEVKKLQELVRKLERQNEQLRTRANAVHILPSPQTSLFHNPASSSYCLPNQAPTPSCHSALGQCCASEQRFACFQSYYDDFLDNQTEEKSRIGSEPTVLDEVELLDLDSIMQFTGESQETWLYALSKSCLWSGGGTNPLQWSRHVLDHLQPEQEAAKRSLCQRLESVSRWRGAVSSPSHSPPVFPHNQLVGVTPLSTSSPTTKTSPSPATRTASCERSVSSIPSSLHPSLLSTPAQSGKDGCVLAERIPSFLYHPARRSRGLRHAVLSPQSSLDSELSTSELEEDSISLGYRLQDLTDVQVMARLQEESLRQDYATTSASSSTNIRRGASLSFQFGQRAKNHLEEEEEDDDDDDDEDYGHLPPPQPRLTRVGPLQRTLSHSHTFTSIRDWRRSTPSIPFLSSTPSTPSTPSNPPSQSQASLSITVSSSEEPSFRASSDKLRRSMPNLVRTPSMPSVPTPANHMASPTTIRNSQSFDSSNGLARLQSSMYMRRRSSSSSSSSRVGEIPSYNVNSDSRISGVPSPGQLQNRVQSVGNVPLSARQTPLKATAYVSPTIKGPSSMTTSTSLHSLSSSGIPQPSKTQPPVRSGLPRPASFIGTSSTPRSKLTQPMRSLLTPPKSLATLSALRDGSWRDGCY